MPDTSTVEPTAPVTLIEPTLAPSGTGPAPASIPGGAPAGAGDAPRTRDEKGHYLPRPKAEGESGGTAVLPAGPRPAHKASKHLRTVNAAPVKQQERAAAVRARKDVLLQAERTAKAINQMLITVATLSVGPECEQSPQLRQRIEVPLAFELERLSPERSELLGRWMNPGLLAMALTEWMLQINRVAQQKRAEKAEAEAAAAPKAPSMSADIPLASDGNNGHHAEGEADTEPKPGERVNRIVTAAEISSQMGSVG